MVGEGGARAAGEADRLEARIGGADRRDARPRPPAGRSSGCRPARWPRATAAAPGALPFGRGITLSLPDGASPMRGGPARRRRCRRRERIARRRTLVAGTLAQHGTQPQDQEDRDQADQDDVVVVTHDGSPPARNPVPCKLHRPRLGKGQGNAAPARHHFAPHHFAKTTISTGSLTPPTGRPAAARARNGAT